MRLLRTDTLVFESFEGDDEPPFAILSHRWQKEEVLLEHMKDGTAKSRQGFDKIIRSAQLAASEGHQYIWIDTCCINKESSAELSEAINSMYMWYKQSTICYAYLADVPSVTLEESDWFTRGWTLQELIAPSRVAFYDQSWTYLGQKHDLSDRLTLITRIPTEILENNSSLYDWSIAQRMSWASQRKTTRKEDLAYCLLGLFDINMSLLYGEGDKAFIRLQEEIMARDNDASILAWQADPTFPDVLPCGLLAPSPAYFIQAGQIQPAHSATVVNDSVKRRLDGIQFATHAERDSTADDMFRVYIGCSKIDIAPGGHKACFIYLIYTMAENARYNLTGSTFDRPMHVMRVCASKLDVDNPPDANSTFVNIFSWNLFHLPDSVGCYKIILKASVPAPIAMHGGVIGGPKTYVAECATGKIIGFTFCSADPTLRATLIIGLSDRCCPFIKLQEHASTIKAEDVPDAGTEAYNTFSDTFGSHLRMYRIGDRKWTAVVTWVQFRSNLQLKVNLSQAAG